MSSSFRGSGVPGLQSETISYDPSHGYLNRREWRGNNPATLNYLNQLQADCIAQGIACQITAERGIYTFESEDATNQFTLDTWQVIGSDESADIFRNPAAQALLNATTSAALRAALQNPPAAGNPFTVGVITGDPLVGLAGGLIQRLYNRYMQGDTDYARGAYVLRHTTNASNRWTTYQNVADINIEAIYTTASLLTEVTSSAFWLFPMPGRLRSKILFLAVPAAVANKQVGWLKSTSTETTAARNRIEITTEYRYGQFSTDDYPVIV